MSRDGFDITDFQRSDWEPQDDWHGRHSSGSGRETSPGRSGSAGSAQSRRRLEQFRDIESSFDRLNVRSHKQCAVNHSGPARDTQELDRNQGQEREEYEDRDRTYSLRPSETHTLAEVAKFRVVQADDLAKFAYNGDRPRMESDLRNLVDQGLVERRATSVFKKESQQVLTITKSGYRLLRQHHFVPEDQAIYSGFVNPKEANHDAALYRLYQKAAEEIERKGAKVLRMELDYELKEKLFRKLGRGQAKDKNEALHLKDAYAQQLHLPVVNGKVSFPDVRIEYANQDMEIARVDLELATSHYHAGHLAEKARAGFQIYAGAEDAAGLRRVRDDREIMTSILSL